MTTSVGRPLRSIYSGKPLSDPWVLDHVLPWSFVAHHQLWNLVPCEPALNSRKSDSLPRVLDDPKLLSRLTGQQAAGLLAFAEAHPERWSEDELIRPFFDELKIDAGAVVGGHAALQRRLDEGYRAYLPSQIGIARLQGFPDWDSGF